jgi:hypothetical protein
MAWCQGCLLMAASRQRYRAENDEQDRGLFPILWVCHIVFS